VAVTEDGQSRPLVRRTRIEVTFENREDGRVLRWQADCNVLGAEVEITPDRLLTGSASGTDVGCPDELHEQDEWLTDFFESDPFWILTNARLVLASGETTIGLSERD
jgi:heat shock protein HslJ